MSVNISDDRSRSITIEQRELRAIAYAAAEEIQRNLHSYDWGGDIPDDLLEWKRKAEHTLSIARSLSGWT